MLKAFWYIFIASSVFPFPSKITPKIFNKVKLLGNCSYFNSVFGDILLIGLEMKIENWNNLKCGDDAADAKLFNMNECPELAFECHKKIFNIYSTPTPVGVESSHLMIHF